MAPLARTKLVESVAAPDDENVPVTLVAPSSSIAPEPDGAITIDSFDLAEIIFQPFVSKLPPNCGDVSSSISFASAVSPYKSSKFALIFVNDDSDDNSEKILIEKQNFIMLYEEKLKYTLK